MLDVQVTCEGGVVQNVEITDENGRPVEFSLKIHDWDDCVEDQDTEIIFDNQLNNPPGCNCGSGKLPWWEFDAQGIPLCNVCDDCVKEQLARFRPCILSGYNQDDVDEPINEDY